MASLDFLQEGNTWMDLLMTIHLHRARWLRIREVSRRVTLTMNKDEGKEKRITFPVQQFCGQKPARGEPGLPWPSVFWLGSTPTTWCEADDDKSPKVG